MSERITAMDVERQQFKRKVRGFDPEEVTLFLRSVSGEIERLNLENATLLEENGRLKAAVKDHATREQTLQQTLVTAQKMSEELKVTKLALGHNADDQAETIEKLTYDLYYIKHMSPVFDLRVLVKSFLTVVTGSGAR